MASKPTIVLVPGAWHNPNHYTPLTNRLEKAGYEVHALHLPSTGLNGGYPENLGDHTPDVALISSTIQRAADAGQDVVVAMHSAGGVTGSEATKNLSKADRATSGLPGGVTHLVFIAAFAKPEGVAIYEPNGPSAWIDIGPTTTFPKDPVDHFYHDCDPAVVEECVKGIGRHSLAAMWTKPTYAAWKHIPSTYLVCEADRAIPVAVQEMWIQQKGARFTVERCGAAHSPFLSMPDLTAEVVRRAAGEKI